MDHFAIINALSQQIAEDLLESSKLACAIKPHNIKNVLPAKTISLIVSKLAKDQGKYVKFKEVPIAFKLLNALPGFVQKNRIDAVLDEGIRTNGLNSLMETICAPIGKDASPGEDAVAGEYAVAGEDAQIDNEIMTMKLKEVARLVIAFYVDADIDYLNDIFELKGKSAGGRKQKSRRGHKQKSRRSHKTRRGHKQKSRRGDKTRRHRHRRSTRKH